MTAKKQTGGRIKENREVVWRRISDKEYKSLYG